MSPAKKSPSTFEKGSRPTPKEGPRADSARLPADSESAGRENPDPLAIFHPVTGEWFRSALGEPTLAQRLGWPPIARRESTLLL
ncbi:MAG: hypothetical protein WCC14_05620, partial [Acidobacteriaceae bacterium]